MLLKVSEIGKMRKALKKKLKPTVVISKPLCRILTEIVSIYRLNKLFDTKFRQNPFSGSVVVCGQAGRHDET